MARPEDLWIPLVDEPHRKHRRSRARGGWTPGAHPLGSLASPHRLLAFRTFAYIRVGILLGELLMESDLDPYDGTENWVDALLADPMHREAVAREVRAVAEEIAADPSYADEDPLGPDEEARRRFREFAKKRLDASVQRDLGDGEDRREAGKRHRNP